MIKHIFVVLILLLTIGSSVSYMASSSLRSFLAMQNAYQMQNALNRLKQSIVFENGVYYAPAAAEGEGYSELPLAFTGARASSKGVPFLYCPYGSALLSTPNGSVTDASGASYATVQATIQSTAVITESDAPPVSGLLATLIMPLSGTPSCADIAVSADGQWALSGDSLNKGQVYAIHRDEMMFEGGHGLWLTAENSAQLASALATASASSQKDIVITLKPGVTFDITSDYVFTAPGASISIKSASSSSVSLTNASGGTRTLSFSGVNLSLANIATSSNFSFEVEHADVKAVNSTLGAMRAQGGRVQVDNVSFVAETTPALVVRDAEMTITNAASFSSNQFPIVDVYQSAVKATDAEISYSQADPTTLAIRLNAATWTQQSSLLDLGNIASGGVGIQVDEASSLLAKNSDILSSGAPDAALYVDGNLSMPGSRVLGGGNVAVYAGRSAVIALTGTQIGDETHRPLLGIWSDGGRLSGSVNVYAGNCKSGPGFDVSLLVNVEDDTVTFANPDGTVVPGSNTDAITVPVFDKINPIQINCL